MLKVETNHQVILLFFREGLSIRKIARKLKINRRTVVARIKEYEAFKSSPLSDQDKPGSLLNQYLKTGSVYNSAGRSKRRLTEDIVAIIDSCLQENEAKKLDGRMKQRLKKIDIHEQILSAGHSISYSTLCEHTSEQKSHNFRKLLSGRVTRKAPVVSLTGFSVCAITGIIKKIP